MAEFPTKENVFGARQVPSGNVGFVDYDPSIYANAAIDASGSIADVGKALKAVSSDFSKVYQAKADANDQMQESLIKTAFIQEVVNIESEFAERSDFEVFEKEAEDRIEKLRKQYLPNMSDRTRMAVDNWLVQNSIRFKASVNNLVQERRKNANVANFLQLKNRNDAILPKAAPEKLVAMRAGELATLDSLLSNNSIDEVKAEVERQEIFDKYNKYILSNIDLNKRAVISKGGNLAKEIAKQTLRKNEGVSYVEDDGNGYPAIYGINKKYHEDAFNKVMELYNSKRYVEAEKFASEYKFKEFWEKNKLDEYDGEIAIVLYDGAVNHRWDFVQELFKAADRGATADDLIAMRRAEYERLALGKGAKNLAGWLNRLDATANSVYEYRAINDALPSINKDNFDKTTLASFKVTIDNMGVDEIGALIEDDLVKNLPDNLRSEVVKYASDKQVELKKRDVLVNDTKMLNVVNSIILDAYDGNDVSGYLDELAVLAERDPRYAAAYDKIVKELPDSFIKAREARKKIGVRGVGKDYKEDFDDLTSAIVFNDLNNKLRKLVKLDKKRGEYRPRRGVDYSDLLKYQNELLTAVQQNPNMFTKSELKTLTSSLDIASRVFLEFDDNNKVLKKDPLYKLYLRVDEFLDNNPSLDTPQSRMALYTKALETAEEFAEEEDIDIDKKISDKFSRLIFERTINSIASYQDVNNIIKEDGEVVTIDTDQKKKTRANKTIKESGYALRDNYVSVTGKVISQGALQQWADSIGLDINTVVNSLVSSGVIQDVGVNPKLKAGEDGGLEFLKGLSSDIISSEDNQQTFFDEVSGKVYRTPRYSNQEYVAYRAMIDSYKDSPNKFIGFVNVAKSVPIAAKETLVRVVNNALDDIPLIAKGAKEGLASDVAIQLAANEMQYNEGVKNILDNDKSWADLKRLLPNITELNSIGFEIGEFDAILRKYLGSKKSQEALLARSEYAAKRRTDIANKILDKIAKDREERSFFENVLYDVGAGGGSLAGVLGVLAVVRDPVATAAVLGYMQKQRLYFENMQAGLDRQESEMWSSIGGLSSAAIEAIGLGRWLAAGAKSTFFGRLKARILAETPAEGLQDLSESSLQNYIGARDDEFGDIVGSALYSMMIASVVSGSASAGIDVVNNYKLKKDAKKILKENLSDNASKIDAWVEDMIETELQSLEMVSTDTVKRVDKIMNMFKRGETIDVLKEIEESTDLSVTERENLIDAVKTGRDDLVRKISDDIIAGRFDKIEEDISVVDREISVLENKLGDDVVERIINGDDVTDVKNRRDVRKLRSLYKKLNTFEKMYFDEVVFSKTYDEKINQMAGRKALVKGKRIIGLSEKLGDFAVAKTKAGMRKAVKLYRNDLTSARKAINKLIDDTALPKPSRDRLKSYVNKIDAPQKLVNRVPEILRRVDREIESVQLQALNKIIDANVKKLKPKTDGGKKVSKLGAIAQRQADRLLAIKNMSVKEAKKALDKNIDDIINGVETDATALENMMLNYVANGSRIDVKDAAMLASSLDEFIVDSTNAELRRVAARDIKKGLLKDIGRELIGEGVRIEKGKRVIPRLKDAIKDTGTSIFFFNGVWRSKLKYIFDSKDKDMVDYLVKELSFTKEHRNLEKANRDAIDRLNKAVKAHTGLDKKEFDKIVRYGEDEVVIDKDMFDANGKKINIRFTRNELIQRWAELQNADIREDIQSKDGMAWTENIIKEIEKTFFADDINKKIADALFEFYDDYYRRVNEVYEDRYGISLGKVDNYVPIVVGNLDTEGTSIFLEDIGNRGSIVAGQIKERRGKDRILDQVSFRQQMLRYMSDVEYWINVGEKASLIDSIFNSKGGLINDVKRKYGKRIANDIKRDIDYFNKRGLYTVETGEKLINTLNRNYGASQLMAKPQIGFKQVTSFLAYADEVSAGDFAKGIMAVARNPKKYFKLLKDSEFFKDRGLNNLSEDFYDIMNDKSLLNAVGRNPTLSNILYLNIRIGDKAAIFLGGAARYYARRKQGWSHERALEDFDAKSVATQQSTDIDQVPAAARRRGVMGIVTQFKSSANALARAELEAFVDWSKGRLTNKEFAKKFAIYHLMIPNLFYAISTAGLSVAGLMSDDDYDYYDALYDHLVVSVLGSFSGLYLLGEVIDFGVKHALNAMTEDDVEMTVFDLGVRHPATAFRSLSDGLSAIAEGDLTLEDFLEGNNKARLLTKGVGGIIGLPIDTGYNMAIGYGKIEEDPIAASLLLMGYSPYILKKYELE